MVKNSTRLHITFFSLLLAVLIVIQYCWIKSVQHEKYKSFRSRILSAIVGTKGGISLCASWHQLSDKEIAAILRQSFASKGLGSIRFEFSIVPDDICLSSDGFRQRSGDDASSLTLTYPLQSDSPNSQAALLTVVIPAWNKYILKDMCWVFAICLGLTAMVIAIFCYALILNHRKRKLCYGNREEIVLHLMRQWEAPLSTISVAVAALGNDKVMYNPEKRRFYQQVIDEASGRMDERVKKTFKQ